MLTPALVLTVAGAVILRGGVAELTAAWRDRHTALSADEARRRLVTEVQLASLLGWAALAAAVLLLPTLWRPSQLPGNDILLVVFVLGLAANRASYLLRRRDRYGRAPLALVAASTALSGLAIGLTA